MKINNEYEKLLEEYIDIFNRAIAENQDRFPYSHILKSALTCSDKGKELHYVIYDKRPKALFSLKMDNGKLSVITKGGVPPENFNSLSYDYLKKVTDNAEEYVKNPELLDWNWLNKA